MGEVKRYEIGPYSRNLSPGDDVLVEFNSVARESDSGDWVRYEDCAAELDAERERTKRAHQLHIGAVEREKFALADVAARDAEIARLRARVESLQAALWLTAEDWMFVRHKEHGHPAGKCLVMAEDELKLLVMCSDTFAYACADCEEAELSETVALRRIAETEGFPGVVRWCQAKGQRGEPIDPVRKTMTTFDSLREDNERLRARVEELEAHRLNVAVECGIYYGAEGHGPMPGPDTVVLGEIGRLRIEAGRAVELAMRVEELETERAEVVAVLEKHGWHMPEESTRTLGSVVHSECSKSRMRIEALESRVRSLTEWRPMAEAPSTWCWYTESGSFFDGFESRAEAIASARHDDPERSREKVFVGVTSDPMSVVVGAIDARDMCERIEDVVDVQDFEVVLGANAQTALKEWARKHLSTGHAAVCLSGTNPTPEEWLPLPEVKL